MSDLPKFLSRNVLITPWSTIHLSMWEGEPEYYEDSVTEVFLINEKSYTILFSPHPYTGSKQPVIGDAVHFAGASNETLRKEAIETAVGRLLIYRNHMNG